MKLIKAEEIIFHFFIFSILTIVGIQTHEISHYIVADILKFKPLLHHSSVSFQFIEMKNNKDYQFNELLIIIAGPLQTIFTGIFGFIMLSYRRQYRLESKFTKLDWFAVFLTLFLLRQVFNLMTSLIKSVKISGVYFGGDEAKISEKLGIFHGTFGIITGTTALIICSITFFYFIPKTKRLNLILGATFGSIISYYLWSFYIGEIVLP